jgi:Tfp pilus assembly protein PilW
MLIRPPDMARDEHGFTLMEMLVAIASGTIVCAALVALLSFATHQQARLSSAVQANQLSRGAMTKIANELHSACIAPEFTPVLEKSDPNKLWFVNAYSEAPVISENSKVEAYEHHVEWNEATGKLIDHIFPNVAAGGSWPKFTFSKTESPEGGVVLATNVTQNKSGGKVVPIFQYYEYTTKSSSGSEAGLSTLATEPIPTTTASPLTAVNAAKVASVLVSFKTAVGVKGKEEERPGGRTVELSSRTTFAFSAPKSESTTVDGPCQ